MAALDELIPALSEALGRLGSGPLNINVSLCDAEIVADLKARIADLEREREEMLVRYNRAELLARSNSLVCMRVVDWCRENGIKIPRRIYEGIDMF